MSSTNRNILSDNMWAVLFKELTLTLREASLALGKQRVAGTVVALAQGFCR